MSFKTSAPPRPVDVCCPCLATKSRLGKALNQIRGTRDKREMDDGRDLDLKPCSMTRYLLSTHIHLFTMNYLSYPPPLVCTTVDFHACVVHLFRCVRLDVCVPVYMCMCACVCVCVCVPCYIVRHRGHHISSHCSGCLIRIHVFVCLFVSADDQSHL